MATIPKALEMRAVTLLFLASLVACSGSNPPPNTNPQTPTHSLSVWVRDASGKALMGANVVSEPALVFPSVDENGWSGRAVPAGRYRVTASLSGYRSAVADVDVARAVDVDLVLQRETPSKKVRRGDLRLCGRALCDDDGENPELGASMFWLAWGFQHDLERTKKNLETLRDGDVDFIRAFAAVGPDKGWEDRTVDPTAENYVEILGGATDLAWSYGLRVEWTIFAGIDKTPTPESRSSTVDRFIQAMQGRRGKIAFVEMANEGWQNGFGSEEGAQELKRYAERVRNALKVETAITAATHDPGLPNYYLNSTATILTAHLERDIAGLGAMWRPVRQTWEGHQFPSHPGAWVSNEPIGPRSSVAMDDDPLRITMSAALTWITGGAAYVLHTGPGVRGGGIADLTTPRPWAPREANFWEVPSLKAIFDGIRSVRTVLPKDVANWTKTNISGGRHEHFVQSYPFEYEPLLAAQDVHGTMLRAFAAVRGPEFVIGPIMLVQSTPFTAKRTMTFRVIHPLTGTTTTHRLGGGETLSLGSDPAAVLIIGRFE